MMKKGDVYCRQEPTTGKYFAFQIIRPGKIDDPDDDTAYLLLDYFDERPPQESDLLRMKPFVNVRWFWRDEKKYLRADTKDFPKDAQLIGNIPPLVKGDCSRFGSWSTGDEHILEAEWMEIPEEQRRRFKEGEDDNSEITIGGVTLPRNWSYIDDELLSAMSDYQKELYELPVACRFKANLYYPQLIPFLETRHTASELTWKNHNQKSLDLSKTYLEKITVDVENLLELSLPKKCAHLNIMGKIHPDLQIRANNVGEKLSISIVASEQGQVIPDLNLQNIRGLSLSKIDNMDISCLPDYYPRLHWLQLYGKPGNILNINALGKLSEIKNLLIEDVFGFTYNEFPKLECWPKLNSLYLESIPKETGTNLKKEFKGKVEKLEISKLRNPEWLAENLTNPLRHWDGSEFVPPGKVKKAFQIYRDFRRVALAAAQQFLTDNDAALFSDGLNELAKEYVLAFNKLDGRNSFIETDEREDICAAFDVILNDVGYLVSETGFKIDAGRIEDIMDEHRDW